MEDDSTRDSVSAATQRAEKRDAQSGHAAGRSSPEEAASFDDEEVDESVRRHYEEMVERGARQKGEGRIP
jgi:hypothetical protein